MSVLDGMSQCWLLSKDCVVWWDAWAAIGTVSAVFVAILLPEIQRRLVRDKANALFALAHVESVISANMRVQRLQDFLAMVDNSTDVPLPSLQASDAVREAFEKVAKAARGAFSGDVDVSRWPSVDIDVVFDVVNVISKLHVVVEGAKVLRNDPVDRDWPRMLASIEKVVTDADEACTHAIRRLKRAARPLRDMSQK